MDCIYLSSKSNQHYCHAQPVRPSENVIFYVPTEEDRKEFCNNSANFPKCPRLQAILDTFKTEYRKQNYF
jgi:hypothetical protein